MPEPRAEVTLAVVGAAGILAYIYRSGIERAWWALRDAIPSPKRPGAQAPRNAASHRAARPIVLEALRSTLGRNPNLAELQYAQAVGWHETNYGRGWKGPMVGSNNWGAVQCRTGSKLPCISYEDSYPDETKYTVSFRKYASPAEGAADMLKNIFTIRPITASLLRARGSTVERASYAMRRENYYGGFCPDATKKYGASKVRLSLGWPDKDEATRSCAREAIDDHARTIDRAIFQIAGSLGEPMAMALGSYDDADAWYRRTHLSVSGFTTGSPDLVPVHGPIPAALLEVRT